MASIHEENYTDPRARTLAKALLATHTVLAPASNECTCEDVIVGLSEVYVYTEYGPYSEITTSTRAANESDDGFLPKKRIKCPSCEGRSQSKKNDSFSQPPETHNQQSSPSFIKALSPYFTRRIIDVPSSPSSSEASLGSLSPGTTPLTPLPFSFRPSLQRRNAGIYDFWQECTITERFSRKSRKRTATEAGLDRSEDMIVTQTMVAGAVGEGETSAIGVALTTVVSATKNNEVLN